MFKKCFVNLVLFFLFSTFVYASNNSVSGSISAQNTFTSSISPTYKSKYIPEGYLNVSISGTWSGTVTLQRSFDAGVTWVDVESYTANDEGYLIDTEGSVLYRIGFKTGGYTSGTAVLRLSN